MKKHFSLRALAPVFGLGLAALRLCGQTTVDSVITSGLFEPYAITVASDGSFYFTDGANHRVLKVPAGLTSYSVLAGQTGIAGTNNGVADAAQFNVPQGIVLARGGLVVADSANHVLRFVSLNGAVSNLAGAPGSFGLVNGNGASARFSYPLGLAADAAGNIYIADSQNYAIRMLDTSNNVTTIASGLYQPAAVAVGDNGDLWITDTRRHCIKRRDINGIVTLVAGVSGVSGTSDSSLATNAFFSNPRGLLWLGGNTGLLIADSGNHAIRRMYFNTNFNGYSVTTYAGTPGVSGAANGPALSASFNSPIGLASDPFGGGFLVADKANNQIRRINTGAVQPPVPDPVLGWVDLVKDSSGNFSTKLNPVVSGVFNNSVTIATFTPSGTSVYFTYGPTPTNPFDDSIPDPGPGLGNNPPIYHDGDLQKPATMVSPQPDLTVKAIGTAEGRHSSAVVQARFIFKTANPSILGDNAASFAIDDITEGAQLWYTWDGSEPTNNVAANPNVIGPITGSNSISFNLQNIDHTFKIKAFRANFKDSDTVTKIFSASNFVANTISFGFADGEASSEFVAAAGQQFYAPVTLSVLPGQAIYSFQFNVVVTNETGLPVDSSSQGFQTSLEYPNSPSGDQVGPDGQAYILIPPATVVGFQTNGDPILSPLVFTDPAINLLGVGWLNRRGLIHGLYPVGQDLITYSQAHDTVFRSSDGKVILGGYSFLVPAGSADGDTYNIQLGRPSATSDGVSQDVYIQVPTNGSVTAGPLNGFKRVTVASRHYLVGDVAPFRWFNAGDFGNTNLLNNDVLQVFQSAVLMVNMPPAGSDFFDAMDSSDGSVNDLFNGSIDQITMGDGSLNVDDIYVTFRRSLDPSLKWYERYWQGGARQWAEVPNGSSFTGPSPSKKRSLVAPTGVPTVGVSADDIVAAGGTTVSVPIRVHIVGGLPIRVAMVGLTVEPLDGSPALTQAIDIAPATGLGSPTLRTSSGTNNLGLAWLNNAAVGVSGDSVLGTLSFQVPASAGASAAYRVHFNHFSCSENGLALFKKYVRDGVVTTTSRTNSTRGDGISDLWRLRFFGSVNGASSAASADPDHDGVSNLAEFQGGTDPLDGACALRLAVRPSAGGVNLTFPTGLGRTYIIECAPALIGPWTTLSTNIGDGIPREFQHSPGGSRFYRVRAQ